MSKVPNLYISGSDLQAALSAVFQTDEVTAGALLNTSSLQAALSALLHMDEGSTEPKIVWFVSDQGFN